MGSRPRVVRLLAPLAIAGAIVLGVGACSSDSGGGGDEATVKLSAAGRRGQQVARDNGCNACHSTNGSKGTGPTWRGLAGESVELTDGTKVVADDAYVRRSITDPRAQVVKGFAAIMPTAYDELSGAELDALVAYLNDLGAPPKSSGS